MDEYIRDFAAHDVKTHVVNDVEEFNNRFHSLECNFKIFHMNIRSVAENLNEALT